MAFFYFCYDYSVAPAEKPERPPSLKDRFFANPLNPMVIIAVASFIAVVPQVLNILIGILGVDSEIILDTMSTIVTGATQIAGILFGIAFVLFFLKRG
ncbi:MAG: hypothetical protein WD940_01615 [Patescibacteria group bacterium]